jgi:hypothetical protein
MAQATEIGSKAACLRCGAGIETGDLCESCDHEITEPYCEKHGLPIGASGLCDECEYETYAARCGECGEHGIILNADGSCPECDEACRIKATAGGVETVRYSQGTSKAVRPANESKANAEPGQFDHQLLRALEEHEATHNIRLGMDYFDGALWYGMKIGKETFFLSSDWRCFPSDKLPQGIELYPNLD